MSGIPFHFGRGTSPPWPGASPLTSTTRPYHVQNGRDSCYAREVAQANPGKQSCLILPKIVTTFSTHAAPAKNEGF